MKHIFSIFLALVLVLSCAGALALTEPNSKTCEQTMNYIGENISIDIEQWCYAFNKTNCRFFLAKIEVADPAQLMTAFAGNEYSKKNAEPTHDIAAVHNAVFAVNGDYYNFKDNVGLIIRNGVLYRDKPSERDVLLVYADGRFEGYEVGELPEGQGEALVEEGVVQAFCFGPLLVKDGEKTTLPKKSYVINTKDTVREPRTAIGQIDATHYVVIVADGRRSGWSDKGMTLQEMQNVFIENGCTVAYNLDGGGSATMVMNGEQINKTSGSRQRNVSDIVYFGE